MTHMAQGSDVPQLLEWGGLFAAQAEIDWYEPDTFEETLMGMIDSADAVVLMHDHGMIGGLCYPHFLNSSRKIAQEVFWWAGRNGRSLMQGFESWAKMAGADEVHMSSLDNLRSGALGRVYQSMGYRPVDHSYARVM